MIPWRNWLIAIVLGLSLSAGAQGFVWTSQIGMAGSPNGDKVAVDTSGNVYVTGWFEGTARFGLTNLTSVGGYDAFLAKYDNYGNLIWVNQMGGTNSQNVGQDICVDTNGNVYVVGSFQGQTRFSSNTILTAYGTLSMGTVNNTFVAKYNSAGTLIWVEQAGGQGGGTGLGITVDNSGYVYTTGFYINFSDRTSMTFDKWSPSGQSIWHDEFAGDPNYTFPLKGDSIKVDSHGNVYVTGEFGTQVTLGSATLQTLDNFGQEIFIAKLDSNGNVLWAEQPVRTGPTSSDIGNSLSLDNQGNIYIVGNYSGTINFGTNQLTSTQDQTVNGFVAECDNNGNYLWVRQIPSNGGSSTSAALDSSGNYYVTGSESPSQVYLNKYGPSGNLLWAIQPGHGGYSSGYGTAIDSSNRVYLVSWTTGSISFDNLSFTNIGGNDLFISQVSEQVPPKFASQPQNSLPNLLAGGNYTFNPSIRSVYPVFYQWQYSGTNIAGATNLSLTITNAQLINQGNYNLIASNLYGSTTSSIANLTVYFNVTLIINGTGTVSISPPNQNNSHYAGDSTVTFTATTNLNDPFIGWSGSVSGTNNPISVLMTSNVLVIASFADSITNIIIDNNDPRVTLSAGWTLGSVYGQYGSSYDFIAASNTPPGTAIYQPTIVIPGYYDVSIWYSQDGNQVSYNFTTNAPWSIYNGTGFIYTNINERIGGGSWRSIATCVNMPAGAIGYVSLSSATGEAISRNVVADAVRFLPSQPPSITSSPQPRTVTAGQNATFTVQVTGSGPFQEQWLFNNTIITNASGSSLTIGSVEPSNAGNYSVTISNLLGIVTSSNALLTVTAPPSPTLASATINSSGQFQLSLSGNSGVTFSIETSTNLINWNTLTNLVNTTGTATFIDVFDSISTDTTRYYRAQWLPQ